MNYLVTIRRGGGDVLREVRDDEVDKRAGASGVVSNVDGDDVNINSVANVGNNVSNNVPVDDQDVEFLKEVAREDEPDSALSGGTSDEDDDDEGKCSHDHHGSLHAQVAAFARAAGRDVRPMSDCPSDRSVVLPDD